jgi:hypothetical protein
MRKNRQKKKSSSIKKKGEKNKKPYQTRKLSMAL